MLSPERPDDNRIRISRRQLIGVGGGGLGVGALAATGVIKGDDIYHWAQRQVKGEQPQELTEEELFHLSQLQTVIKSAINPLFYNDQRLEAMVDKNRPSAKGLSGLIYAAPDASEWNVGLTPDDGGQPVSATIRINYADYGNSDLQDKRQEIRSYDVVANLLNASIPEIAPFVQPDGKALVNDYEKLIDLAKTFFILPEEINWKAYAHPDTNPPDIVTLFGKYGGPDPDVPSYELNMLRSGFAELSYTRALLTHKGQ